MLGGQARKVRAEAMNALESAIYKTRSDLSEEDFESVTTEPQRDELLQMLEVRTVSTCIQPLGSQYPPGYFCVPIIPIRTLSRNAWLEKRAIRESV